jgi:SSS family solute:Na+ symporter
MQLAPVDWAFIIGFFVIALVIGIAVSRKAGEDASQFFLSGRGMPWWLLGFSMVATTFSTDTPNLVTDIVRKNGVAGNWVWWAFLLTGMLTVFVYARLWRRSGVLTDIEFYEIRYSGKPAAFLRGFRALYVGVGLNVVIMSAVSLAAIKIGAIMFGFSPLQSILVASTVTVIFSAMGGLRSVILTDFLLFILAMTGAVAAAWVALDQPEVGGLSGLFSHPNVKDKLDLVPDFDFSTPESRNLLFSIFLIPIAIQWWASVYPGSEPGGGGYMAQRMLAAKNEQHATGAAFFFNVAHYALRPWPWIIVALASLIVFPELSDIQEKFPQVTDDKLGDDLAYPAMLTFLPKGVLGLVVTSLMAAYMSTISTHLNWGSAYVANDFYKRFVKPDATDRELIRVGRFSTVLMMVLAGGLALSMQNALGVFDLILGLGAGTGLVYILRWLWWRVNAWSEIVAMATCLLVVLVFQVIWKNHGMEGWQVFSLNVLITSTAWIIATFLTGPSAPEKLEDFCRLVRPPGSGWKKVYERAEVSGRPIPSGDKADNLPRGILNMSLGCLVVYGLLLGTGCLLYGRLSVALGLYGIAAIAGIFLFRGWKR